MTCEDLTTDLYAPQCSCFLDSFCAVFNLLCTALVTEIHEIFLVFIYVVSFPSLNSILLTSEDLSIHSESELLCFRVLYFSWFLSQPVQPVVYTILQTFLVLYHTRETWVEPYPSILCPPLTFLERRVGDIGWQYWVSNPGPCWVLYCWDIFSTPVTLYLK